MTRERFEQISAQGGVVDLSARAKWTLSGADRVRYLNGQVTNQVKRAAPTSAVHACVTNVKGRVEGDIFIHEVPASGEQTTCLLVDAAADLRETLGMRLEKYIIADDVELLDVTEDWQVWHFFGALADQVLTSHAVSGRKVRARRFAEPGLDVWLPAGEQAPSLPADQLLTLEEAETWRIVQGVPAWPAELNAEVFPPESGLQDQVMDYAKGCYIGQEILSRIKTSGKMPQTLVRVQAQDVSAPLQVGSLVYHQQDDGTLAKVGEVTSVAHHPVVDRPVGLAYVKQAFGAKDSLLLAPDDPHKITFVLDINPS